DLPQLGSSQIIGRFHSRKAVLSWCGETRKGSFTPIPTGFTLSGLRDEITAGLQAKCYIYRFMSAPESRFVKACKAQPVDRTPVWFMRQAGRYMAEYRAVRKQYSLIEICKKPEVAADVTIP